MRLTRTLIENRDKVVLAPASSAYKHSLKEVLSSPGIAARIKNTKAAKEVEALQVGAWKRGVLRSYSAQNTTMRWRSLLADQSLT